MSGDLYGGIEAGGTKFVCVVGRGPDRVMARVRFPTTTPEATLARAVAFFRPYASDLVALGVGCFGPVDLHPSSSTYGYITTTPKPGWQNTDVRGYLERALRVPVVFDTDVNAAAWGEYRWGAGQGVDTLVYVTVGTGIGGGAVVDGRRLHGLMHPEMGHMRVPHDRAADPFDGVCPFHGDCLEGLASGPAIAARWGRPGEALPADHPAWDLEARYLGLAVVNLICILSPRRIILGGGVMRQRHLFPRVRRVVQEVMADYVRDPALADRIHTYIVPPGLGDDAGVLGALALAMDARDLGGERARGFAPSDLGAS